MIESGDGEGTLLYYLFSQHHILPSQWLNLPNTEKAALIAFVELKVKAEKKEMAKAKSGRRRGR